MHALHAAQLQLLQVATVQVLEQYLPARHAAALIGEAKLLTVRAPPAFNADTGAMAGASLALPLTPPPHT